MSDTHKERMQKKQAQHKERVQEAHISRGVIIVNTGDGKGKSTAAFGTAFRAAGYGIKVGIVQFIKGKWKTGEQQTFGQFDNITHIISGGGFTWETQNKAKDIELAMNGWEAACAIIEDARNEENSYQLLVLDEINIAMDLDYIPTDTVVEALKNKPENLSIILTGRHVPVKIIEIADTVTEMTPIKHAFDQGIRARKGIEF